MADKMKENFVTTAEKFKAQNLPKRIVKDGSFLTSFMANGYRYQIMMPEEIFNIGRQTAYNNIKLAFDACQTVTEIKQRFVDIKHCYLGLVHAEGQEKARLTDLLLKTIWNAEDSFKGEFTSKYPAALYLCTLFVIKEDEDLSKWSWDLANQKINDWDIENISCYDFFLLALYSSEESLEIMKQNYQSQEVEQS